MVEFVYFLESYWTDIGKFTFFSLRNFVQGKRILANCCDLNNTFPTGWILNNKNQKLQSNTAEDFLFFYEAPSIPIKSNGRKTRKRDTFFMLLYYIRTVRDFSFCRTCAYVRTETSKQQTTKIIKILDNRNVTMRKIEKIEISKYFVILLAMISEL
jgi:hypothetical protein